LIRLPELAGSTPADPLQDLAHLLIRALLLQLPGLLDGVNFVVKQPEPALLLASALVRDGQDVLLVLDL
jgi:hypothetical protein